MRVYVMTDLEGVSGVWSIEEQCVPSVDGNTIWPGGC